MMKLLNLLVLASLLLVAYNAKSTNAATIVANCNYNSSGTVYDFTDLAKNFTEYSTTMGAGLGASTLYWSFCQVSPTCSKNVANAPNSAACQKSGTNWYNLGGVQTMTIGPMASGTGSALKYTNPNQCSGGTVPRTLEIDMTCTPGKGYVVSSAAENPTTKCLYQVAFSSGLACAGATPSDNGGGKKGGIGGGWIFVIILLVSFSVYVLVGLAVNFKVRNLRGKEMFPNYSFWSDLPGLMKDGIFFIKGKITGSGTSAGYQQV